MHREIDRKKRQNKGRFVIMSFKYRKVETVKRETEKGQIYRVRFVSRMTFCMDKLKPLAS